MRLVGLFGHLDPLYSAVVLYEEREDRKKERIIHEAAFTGTNSEEKIETMYAELISEADMDREDLHHFQKRLKQWRNQEQDTCLVASRKKTEYAKSEQILHNRFGDGWLRLSEDARICLVSARTLLFSTEEYEGKGFDYSGISITASSALEYQLKTVFYTPLLERFHKQYNNLKDWPKAFFRTKKRDGDNSFVEFTLGTLPYILGIHDPKWFSDDQKSIVTDFLKDIIREDVYRDKSVYCALTEPLQLPGFVSEQSLLSIIEDIRLKYRNPAAHTARVEREAAQSCYRAVAGVEDDMNQIESALELLLFILKP